MVFTSSKYSFLAAFIILVPLLVFAGPPDKEVDEDNERFLELEDSLRGEKERLLTLAESLAITFDTLRIFNLDIEDLPNLPSYREIIIDENGIIKVLTDSGFIVISADSLPLYVGDIEVGNLGYSRGQITRWGKSIIIDDGERIASDIIIISGDVTVNGTVDGDVVVIGGDIYVNSTGYIRGDATSIGGRVKKEEGAKVAGTTVSVSVPLIFLPRGSWMQVFEVVLLLIIVISLFFSALSISLFPKPVERISSKLKTNPLKSFFFGYLLYIGAFLVWLLLLVSVIGIPLALLGQPIALMVLVVFAYAAINVVLGERIFKEQSRIKSFFYGCLITTALPFFLLLIGYATNLLVFFILNAIFLAFLIFILLPFGLGAATLARFGLPRRSKSAAGGDEPSAAVSIQSE